MKLSPQQQRGDRLEPLTPECVAAEIEGVWLKLGKLPSWRDPIRVCVTQRGHVTYGSESERYATAVEVGCYNSRVSLADLREDVFHVWAWMHR